jgi:hypothetical protein
MDPNHTLASLRQALIDEDHEAYTEALEALLEWERSGGCMPDWPEPDAVQPDRSAKLRQWLCQLVETALLVESEVLELLPLLERAGLLRLGHTLTMKLARFAFGRTPKPPYHP